jgi:hypothetical protein
MPHRGFVNLQARSSNGNGVSSGSLHARITTQTLARFPDLVHAPRKNCDEIWELYRRASVDAEELFARRDMVLTSLVSGALTAATTAHTAAERVIPLYRCAYSMLLCVALGCNAMLSALSPWDVSLAEDSARYCDDVLALAPDMAQYRPLGATYFPPCLVVAYMTVTKPAKQKRLKEFLIDFQKDFAWLSWLDIATKARVSYWGTRRAQLRKFECGGSERSGESPEDESVCAVQ